MSDILLWWSISFRLWVMECYPGSFSATLSLIQVCRWEPSVTGVAHETNCSQRCGKRTFGGDFDRERFSVCVSVCVCVCVCVYVCGRARSGWEEGDRERRGYKSRPHWQQSFSSCHHQQEDQYPIVLISTRRTGSVGVSWCLISLLFPLIEGYWFATASLI